MWVFSIAHPGSTSIIHWAVCARNCWLFSQLLQHSLRSSWNKRNIPVKNNNEQMKLYFSLNFFLHFFSFILSQQPKNGLANSTNETDWKKKSLKHGLAKLVMLMFGNNRLGLCICLVDGVCRNALLSSRL